MRLFGYFKFKGVYIEDTRVIRVIVILEENLVGMYVVKFHTLNVLRFRLVSLLLWLRHRIVPRSAPGVAT